MDSERRFFDNSRRDCLSLEGDEGDVLFGDDNNQYLVAHIFSNDCPNISSAIKALITSFTTTERELGYVSIML